MTTTPTPRPPEIRFTKATLPNGLEVLARRQGPSPIVAVNLWYHVGSKDEERRQRGFAHLFEHLMFEGSEHFPGDFFKPLQRLGAGVNGSTSTDRTNYFVDLPAAHVETALGMESDRMGHLLPALTDAKLRVQKDVVKNEYRQNYANRPYGQVWRHLAEALFPPEHPYSWLTIGVMEDVEAATRDDVEAFFRRHYVPANASLALVGDLDEDRAISLAETYFGPIPGGTRALPPWTPDRWRAGPVEIVLRDRVELDRVYLTWVTVPQFTQADAALVLLADVLARGKSSRLYRKLVMDEGLAQDVTAYQAGRELAGTFGVVATLRPGKAVDRARALILDAIRAIAEAGPTDEEMERAKNGRLAGFIYALDNVGGFGGVADRLNAYNIFLGDAGRITSDFERYRAVAPDDVRHAAAAILGAAKGLAILTVSGGQAATTAPPLDRNVPPPTAPAVPFRAPRPEVLTLGCGAPLWVLPRRDLPIIAATAVLAAGAGAHGPERGGLASLTADMMDEGTTSRTALDLALAAEMMGTSLSSSSGWDGSYVGFQCLSPHLDASLDLACDVLLRPSFPESEWPRVHGQALAALKAEHDSAEARAQRALLRALYGPDHPYRLPADGDVATVAALGLDDLKGFHGGHYRPGRAAWVVAGDVDPDAIARALDALLEGWSGAAEPLPPVARPADAGRPRLLLLDRPGSAQAVLRVGHVGIDRLDPAYHDLLVLNQVLGGQFTSRLNAKLREEKGFTYGVRSHFDVRRGSGPFSISASVQSDRVAEALDDVRIEVEALLGDRPPSPAEIDDARRALIEGQSRHFETPTSLVARYANLLLHGLPPEEHALFPERLGSVTRDSILEGASRHLRPGSLVAVVVADASTVADSLNHLGWAPVEHLDESADHRPR
ncbi:MAG TPA: pitrilysin family protein [Isosphaeraceae bacterium]|jgi:predicted Zn-dependent peptidase|nr:pitrilysin family protein [Isosphaeraceae bacterium]